MSDRPPRLVTAQRLRDWLIHKTQVRGERRDTPAIPERTAGKRRRRLERLRRLK